MAEDDYARGFRHGWIASRQYPEMLGGPGSKYALPPQDLTEGIMKLEKKRKKSRKLSKWQKFVKAKSKLPRFKYKTGKRKGMVNMKAVAAAWKKVPKSKK